ncbi:MAG: NAD(P)H-dependent flavin oxidoreductase, partial [Sphingobacteriia bacterium]
ATGGPVGVNIPLLYRHVPAIIQLVEEEAVPVVITSAGNPATWTPRLKAAGCRVLHVVSTARFARKAEQAGVDAVICEGVEAGGHNGREELTTLVLVPLVRAAVSIPVVAAGGIATGGAIAAALALGADGVQIGTRFALTQESSAHPAYKQAALHAGEGDTALALKTLVPVRMLRNAFYHQVAALEQQGAGPDALRALLGTGRSRRGILEGDLEEGELEVGQVAAQLHDLPSLSQCLQRLLAEYRQAVHALPPQL